MLVVMDSSAEYEKLVRCSSLLRVACQAELTSLSEDLHADGMISMDNKTEILNQSTPLPHRATKLVDLITNRVKVVKEDYRNFVAILRRNQRVYKPILVIRKFVLDDHYPLHVIVACPLVSQIMLCRGIYSAAFRLISICYTYERTECCVH